MGLPLFEKGLTLMNKNLLIGIVVVAFIAGAAILWSKGHNPSESGKETSAQAPAQPQTPAVTSEPKVEITDSVVGKGAEAVAGKSVTVNYTGTLKDGTKFDSSIGREPFVFNLGSGQVIKGWEQGIPGMKVGGKRKLVIPPELAYGANTVGAIPANSTLTFEVELLDVK